ncbi:MAG: ferrous iron transport protein A [Clostridia bacterium]|nr:ferrous iron transport protein A [Clostridia bacterium]
MPIILAPLNKELKILRVMTDEKTKKHLENLGVVKNGTLTVLSAGGGAVVCKIKEGRVALDSNISTKILVAEVG